MIIMKFGGTSTQDANAIQNVVQIVSSKLAQKPIVVISAIAQATNMLEQAGKLAAEGKAGEARDTLLKLFDRHYAIVDEIIRDRERHIELRKTIVTALHELEQLITGVSILRELTPRTLDAFCCYGELLSSRMVAAALEEQGIAAIWIDTKDFMVTDENFNRAMPLMEIVEERLTSIVPPLIEQGKTPVTQGFIGITRSGIRTTMGRESSDYSASIVGTALNAEDIQIWTDVDGVLTADPQVVISPKKIKSLTFEEAFDLSYFGAKVLHPNTMLPALEKKIPIHIYNSRRPELSGTLVTADTHSEEKVIKSVAYKRGMIVLTITPKKRYSQSIFWEHIYTILTRHDVVATMTATSEYSIAIALDGKNNISAIVHELGEIGLVQVLEHKGIVCVVGTNLRETSQLMERIFRSLSEFNVSAVSFGASKSSVAIVLDDAVVLDAVGKLHREFFETVHDEEKFEMLEHFHAQT
ncbi:MAG: aspartate kinase [Ignavibacteriae bacterium]|nr:aspartate kinase [Ignavibacteriota bacterium]